MSRVEFEITWLNWDQQPYDATIVRRFDLTAAITAACRLMRTRGDAHGFFVRRKEDA